MIRNLHKYLFFVCLCINSSNTQNDMFSSITTLQDVLKTEKIMFNNLEKFIKESELKIIFLKRFINGHEPSYENSNLLNITTFSKNPLGKIITLKKFLKKSGLIELLLSKFPETDLKNFARFQLEHSYPTDEDLEGIISGIIRLQKVYDLTANDFIKDYEIKFASSDLYEIGYKMVKLNEDKFATEWLTESLNQLKSEEDIFSDPIQKITILDALSMLKWREGGIANSIVAKNIVKEILDINPKNEAVKANMELFNSPFIRNDEIINKKTEIKTNLFNKGCRGQLRKPSAEIRELHCKYLTKNHPFLKLARVKYEELNKEPSVILFHDIISDQEIERLKTVVKGNLERARVWDVMSGTDSKSEIRISKFAWLDVFDDKVVPILRQRGQDITNLAEGSDSYEKLQMGNYGIGGHYAPHFDFFRDALDENVQKYNYYEAGNRIATLMYYLSDIRKGGATVLPYMNLTIWPKKGTAVFWYNLHANGEPDIRTMHAACPVIEGSKWVANQWIRFREQIFRRPCELINDSKIENQ